MSKGEKRKIIRILLFTLPLLLLTICGVISVSAESDEKETVPDEYGEFLGSLDSSVADKLPDSAFSDKAEEIENAAGEISSPQSILSLLLGAFADGLKGVVPSLALILCVVLLSALISTVASGTGGMAGAVESCIKLCTFCAISGTATACLERLSEYFDSLFAEVSSFIPLGATLLAMGGNLNAAASNTASLGVIMTVCEFFCTKTVIPLFCVCLCMCLLSVFDGVSGVAGGTVSATLRKWYTTALSFLMMILTVSLGASSLIAAKADNMAMRGAKFAISSFVPVSGGSISSTLGTLAASVELMRSSVGVIGIVVIMLLLLPTIIELALLRGVFALSSFFASLLGRGGESRLLSDIESLYGSLEGMAALSAAVFVIAFGVIAAISTPFS